MEKYKQFRDTTYYVSKSGKIVNRKNNLNKEVKGSKNNHGYLRVNLCKEGKAKGYFVHRLVAEVFIPNPDNLPEVNHKDENPQNNRVENLEWCDKKYNINYGTRNERVAKINSIPILQFGKTGEFIKKWDSAREVERELGFQQNHISSCCKGKRKTAYGYEWGYEKDYERIKFNVFDLTIYQRKVA